MSPSFLNFSSQEPWEAYSIASLGAGVAVQDILYSIPRQLFISAHLILPPPVFNKLASSRTTPPKYCNSDTVSFSSRGINFSGLTIPMPPRGKPICSDNALRLEIKVEQTSYEWHKSRDLVCVTSSRYRAHQSAIMRS